MTHWIWPPRFIEVLVPFFTEMASKLSKILREMRLYSLNMANRSFANTRMSLRRVNYLKMTFRLIWIEREITCFISAELWLRASLTSHRHILDICLLNICIIGQSIINCLYTKSVYSNVCCYFLFYVFSVVLLFVFCTGHCVMAPLNFTLST